MQAKRITIGTPHRDDFTADYVISLVKMMANSKHIIAPYFLRSNGILEHTRGEILLNNTFEADYVLFVDSDTEFMPHSLDQLISHNKDIVSGVVHMGTYPHAPAVFLRHPEHGLFAHMWDLPGELFQADAVGAAFLLVSRKVIDAFRAPGAIEEWGDPFARIQGFSEDISFCIRVKSMGFEIWVDPTLYMGHQKIMNIDNRTWLQTREKALRRQYGQLLIEEPAFAKRLLYTPAEVQNA